MIDNAQRASELTTKFPVEPKHLKQSNFGTAQMHLFIQKEDITTEIVSPRETLIKIENEDVDGDEELEIEKKECQT